MASRTFLDRQTEKMECRFLILHLSRISLRKPSFFKTESLKLKVFRFVSGLTQSLIVSEDANQSSDTRLKIRTSLCVMIMF